MYTLMICGSRDYPLPDKVPELATRHWAGYHPDNIIILTGGAKGPDQIAELAARAAGLAVIVARPDGYQTRGRAAPLYRNVDLVRGSDEVVAFWDGKSKGTLHATEVARKRCRKLTIYGPDGRVMGPLE